MTKFSQIKFLVSVTGHMGWKFSYYRPICWFKNCILNISQTIFFFSDRDPPSEILSNCPSPKVEVLEQPLLLVVCHAVAYCGV